ncbi:MAG TPA: GTPase Era [Solirubrobacterales bacterium]|nr:GTPase Era [Solirubrobacterales bacterium]
MTVDLADVPEGLRGAVAAALAAAGVKDGHLGLELADAERIRTLNREHRGRDETTDVLSFPVDGPEPTAGPRELGDVVLHPPACEDLAEAAVHGVLHLCGHDHETDEGEMLELQEQVIAQIKAAESSAPAPARPETPDSRALAPASGSAASLSGGSATQAAGGSATQTRAGFVGLAGRPNVGKSTLVNAIVGARVAIVSSRPQTTRRAIRGVMTDPDAGYQLVLVDLPGVQRPRDVLTERMQRRVERELADSDVALVVVNGEEGVGPGDRFIARTLIGAGGAAPVVCAVNKIDKVGRGRVVEVLSAAAELPGIDEVFPVSARTGEGVEELVRSLAELVPEGPFLYPPEDHSDQPSEVMLAELIREQVLNRTREELPHSVEVDVKEVSPRDDGLVVVAAEVWAESESQKGILIGKGGAKVREIGTAARRQLELELGARVHLDLQVRVRRRWRRDEGLLDRLGIE